MATIPDLADIAREVAGPLVSISVLAKGTEDPHFLEVKPSFVKALNDADLFVRVGLDLEAGYLPPLLENARNARVLPGRPGYIDAGTAIVPVEVPVEVVDRSMGDVHPYGNPHYWLDPINGARVARLLRDRLTVLRPADKALFDSRCAAFVRRIHVALVGEALATKYDAEKLATLFEHGRLQAFLEAQGDVERLAGWLALVRPYYGAKAVDDHNMWPYFARRFGLRIVGHLEPKPGIPPTTSHLTALVEQMRAAQVRLVLASPYYDLRHARFVSQATGAEIVPLTHLVGGRPGTDNYVGAVNYNVRQVVAALQHGG